MTLRVELATEQDLPAWLDLAGEVSDLFGVDMAREPSFHDWLRRNIARGAAFCVRINGELAGAMQYRRGWIHWLAVGKRFQRHGVGRALVTHAIAQGESEVRVTTFGLDHPHPDSAAARCLYCAMSFQSSAEVPEPVADGTAREILIWRAAKAKLDNV